MNGPSKNINKNKFCEFHGDKGYNTDECTHMKKQIEEAVKSGQLSHLIIALKKRGNKGEPVKASKKGETSKEKAATIFMVQPWQRVTRQKVTKSFFIEGEISFSPLTNSEGQENLMVIKAEIGGHLIHRMYVDGGSALEIIYEHCFIKLHLDIKNRMVPATTPLLGFSGEIMWPLGKISLMVSDKCLITHIFYL
ncbi:hypothetical protein Tco_0428379 [Tanacetum coccineum]